MSFKVCKASAGKQGLFITNDPTPHPDVGGVLDWLGMAAMSVTLRTPAHDSLHQSGIEAPSRFDTRFRHRQSHALGSYRSLPLRTASHSDIESATPAAIASLLTAMPKRIRLSPLHRVSVQQAALTLDGVHCISPMLDKSLGNAYGEAKAHSMLQSSCASLPLLESPVLSLRSAIDGGMSLPEALLYARRTQCFSPHNEHSHTSTMTKLSLEASSGHDFV